MNEIRFGSMAGPRVPWLVSVGGDLGLLEGKGVIMGSSISYLFHQQTEISRGVLSSANRLYLLVSHQFRAENSLCIICVQYPFRSVSERQRAS
jgi:hypothetical protein